MEKIKKLAFTGGLLIDGSGKSPVEDAVVVIEGNKIAQIADTETANVLSGAKVIDISGKTIMPGMIDSHVHASINGDTDMARGLVFRSPHTIIIDTMVNMRTTVLSGITTIRTVGDIDGVDISLRNAITQGKLIGPRVFASGQGITRTGGHGNIVPPWLSSDLNNCCIVDGPEEIRKAIRVQLRAGADYIKVFQTGGVTDHPEEFALQEFSQTELELIHEETKLSNKDTGTHAHNKDGIITAINAGTRSIEHGSGFDNECARLAIEKGVYYSPTLAVYDNMLKLGTDGGLKDYMIDIVSKINTNHRKNVKNAAEQGVKIVTGTDAGSLIGHGTCAIELQLFVDCGLSEMEAIVCATKNGAEMLHLGDQIGTIEPGKYADLIIIEGNPIQDITILQNTQLINWILKEGHPIKVPPELYH